MKRLTIIIIVCIVLIAGAYFFSHNPNQTYIPATSSQNIPTPTTASAKLKILFPTKNDLLKPGKTYTLKWSGGSDQIQIFLIDTSLESQGESVATVDRLYGINNSGSYDYTIPSTIKPGTYVFEIGNRRSDTFKIVK